MRCPGQRESAGSERAGASTLPGSSGGCAGAAALAAMREHPFSGSISGSHPSCRLHPGRPGPVPPLWETPRGPSLQEGAQTIRSAGDPGPPLPSLLPPFPSFLIQLQLRVPFRKDAVVQVLQRQTGMSMSSRHWQPRRSPEPAARAAAAQRGWSFTPTPALQPQPGFAALFMPDEGTRCPQPRSGSQRCKPLSWSRETARKAPTATPALTAASAPAGAAYVPPGGPRGWGLSGAPRHGPSKTELQGKRPGRYPVPGPPTAPRSSPLPATSPLLSSPSLPWGAQLGLPKPPS